VAIGRCEHPEQELRFEKRFEILYAVHGAREHAADILESRAAVCLVLHVTGSGQGLAEVFLHEAEPG
jgi:hypothetical protein